MLYSCTHMATVGVKGLNYNKYSFSYSKRSVGSSDLLSEVGNKHAERVTDVTEIIDTGDVMAAAGNDRQC